MFTTDADYRKMLHLRGSFARRIITTLFADADLLVTPVWPFLLPDRAASDAGASSEAASLVQRIGHNTRPFNWLGLPVVVVPVGLDRNGLPMAVQLVGPPFGEAMLIRAARVLEKHYAFWDNAALLIGQQSKRLVVRWPPSTGSTAPVINAPASLASSNRAPSRSSPCRCVSAGSA